MTQDKSLVDALREVAWPEDFDGRRDKPLMVLELADAISIVESHFMGEASTRKDEGRSSLEQDKVASTSPANHSGDVNDMVASDVGGGIDEDAMKVINSRLSDPWHKTFARDVIELYLRLSTPSDTALREKAHTVKAYFDSPKSYSEEEYIYAATCSREVWEALKSKPEE